MIQSYLVEKNVYAYESQQSERFKYIDLFIKFCFVLKLISLSSLATTSKFQRNICFKMRAVGLININTKECKSGHHLWKWSIRRCVHERKVSAFIGK